MIYTHRPSPHQTAVNAVNADATADLNTADPTDTPINGVGHPKSPAEKTADPGSKLPPSNQPVWVPCSELWKQHKQTDMDYRIDRAFWGKWKGVKPKGGNRGGGGGKGGGGDKGGRGGKGDKGGRGAP